MRLRHVLSAMLPPRIAIRATMRFSKLALCCRIALTSMAALGVLAMWGVAGLSISAVAQPASQSSSLAHWQHPEAGMPLVEAYTPDDYGADSQNWAALQDSSQVLYVANTSGVLTFDGAQWTTIPVANRSIVRGLAHGADGRIYVGAQDELGYLESTAREQRYVSLRDRITEGPDDLGNIWRVQSAGNYVYFQTYKGLYRWSISDERMRYWAPPEGDTFFPLSVIRGTPYVGTLDGTLHAVEHDTLRAVVTLPSTESGGAPTIRAVAPYGTDQILMGTNEGLFYAYGNGTLTSLSLSFASEIEDALPYSLMQLSDGTYALGTIGDAGLFLFTEAGELVRQFSFPRQPVLGLHEDHEGGIWAMLDGGLRRIDWNAPISVFAKQHDEELITDVVRHNGLLTVSTNQGVGTVEARSEPGTSASIQMHPPYIQVWNLHADGDDLLAGTSDDLIRWLPGGASEGLGMRASHGFRVTAPPQTPNQLYVSTSRGIEHFERTNRTDWTRTGTLLGDIGSFSRPAWASDSTLWVGTRYSGVVRIVVDADGRAVSTEQFTTQHGLPRGHVMPFHFGDAVFFSTEEGGPPLRPGGQRVSSHQRSSVHGRHRYRAAHAHDCGWRQPLVGQHGRRVRLVDATRRHLAVERALATAGLASRNSRCSRRRRCRVAGHQQRTNSLPAQRRHALGERCTCSRSVHASSRLDVAHWGCRGFAHTRP